jgi:hypothetical protein
MNSAIYRDSVVVAASRRDEALRRWRTELSGLPTQVKRVYARRMGRTAAGTAAIVVVGAMIGAVLEGDRGPTRILLLAVPCALVAYLLARLFGRFQIDRLLARAAVPSGDVWHDLDRFERGSPLQVVQAAADRLERASVALPMIGTALVAPLTIHYLYFVCTTEGAATPEEFDAWVRMSSVIVGHCHLVLAVLCWRFATHVRSRPTADLAWAPGRDGWSAWGLTIASSVFPGLALLFIPVLLVAITGVVFIPAMFRFMSLRISRERLTLVEPHDAFAYA